MLNYTGIYTFESPVCFVSLSMVTVYYGSALMSNPKKLLLDIGYPYICK